VTLQPEVQTLWPGLLFDGRTGLSYGLSPAVVERWLGGEAPGPLVLSRAAALGMMGGIDILACRVLPNPDALLLPARPALLLPHPFEQGPGGHARHLWPLSPAGLALWRAPGPTLRDRARQARRTEAEALSFAARAVGAGVQAWRLLPPGLRVPFRLVTPPRPAAPRPAGMLSAEGETQLGEWHRTLAHGEGHFDEVETTLAWSFGLPHPALGGQTYGARLAGALSERGLLPSRRRRPSGTMGSLQIVEIGPGSGEVARALLDHLGPDWGGRYTRVEGSPGLRAVQRALLPETDELAALVPPLDLPDASVDLLLANEVIADLSSAPWAPGEGGPVAEWVGRFGLHVHPGRAWYNTGSFALLLEIGRVLRPGGAAVLTEFGDEEGAPEEAAHLDHAEVGICWAHLATLARALGLEATLCPVAELLRMDLGAPWLRRGHWASLRALAHLHGQSLPARAWTLRSLPTPPEPVEGLAEVTLRERGAGPDVGRFSALILRRSALNR
jgi:SAM-dependent methyltransferase